MFDPKNGRGSRNTNQAGDDWKADAFLNCFLPRKNGTRMKLGYFPLKSNNIDQQKLIEWIRENPEERLVALLDKLVIEFHEVSQQEESDLDL